MIPWLYRWLPIIFGCHCRPDRSFFWRGHQFPLCARCTGELAGILTAALTWWAWRPGALWCVVLLAPMVLDGAVQLATAYVSRNRRRLWTGVLFGYGLAALFLYSMAHALRQGQAFGVWLLAR